MPPLGSRIQASIRPEQISDRTPIREITTAAFTQSELDYHGEADLIDVLRANCTDALSLVACLQETVVGHILFTPVVLKSPIGQETGMGIAPLSVAPAHQKKGIGAKLITEGLAQLNERNNPFVVVLGHPNYYARFGFVPAAQFGISHGFAGIPQEAFLIQPNLEGPALTQLNGTVAHYHPAFGL